MTDVLAQIDHALAVQDATAYGDSDWLPGDPLYRRPSSLRGGQVIRPMFQVLDDGVWINARCEPCQVSWRGDDPCWVCATDRPRPDRSRSTGEVQVHLDVDASQYETALARVQEQMRALAEQVQADLVARFGDDFEASFRQALFPSDPPALPEPPPLQQARWSFLPAVADPAAPTMAELADAVPLDGLFSGILTRAEPEPVLDERLAAIDPAEHRDRPVTIRPQDPDDTVTRAGFFGRLTLARPRYPRPDTRLDNQENR